MDLINHSLDFSTLLKLLFVYANLRSDGNQFNSDLSFSGQISNTRSTPSNISSCYCTPISLKKRSTTNIPKICLPMVYQRTVQPISMPRKEYKSITVKNGSYEQFKRVVKEAKKKDKSLDNSSFLDMLMKQHQRSKRTS